MEITHQVSMVENWNTLKKCFSSNNYKIVN